MESSSDEDGDVGVVSKQVPDNRMTGGGKVKSRKRSATKVKSFKREWLEKSINGIKTDLWLKPDATNPQIGVCTVCPALTRFSVNEGWSAIVQHNKGKQHQAELEKSQADPEPRQKKTQQLLTEGLKKMEERGKVQLGNKEALLVAQTRYAFSMAYHRVRGTS